MEWNIEKSLYTLIGCRLYLYSLLIMYNDDPYILDGDLLNSALRLGGGHRLGCGLN